MSFCLSGVSRRQPDGLVGHHGHANVEFGKQPVDRCVFVVCCVLLHSMSQFVTRTRVAL
jgi:hypothetical protein